jgi:hypothetical protein
MHNQNAVGESRFDRSGMDVPQPGSLPALSPSADAAASRIAKLEQQCTRLAHELSAVSCDADRRDGEYRDQIQALVKRLSECESELADRELRLVTVTQSYEALRSQVEGGNVPTAAAVDVYRREIRRNAEVAMSLRKRLDERGRALDLAGEQIAALHGERARLIDALQERTRQVVELVAQLTRGEVRDGFGIDFQTGLGRLVERTPSLSSSDAGSVGWNTPGINEQTIVLESASGNGTTPPPQRQRPLRPQMFLRDAMRPGPVVLACADISCRSTRASTHLSNCLAPVPTSAAASRRMSASATRPSAACTACCTAWAVPPSWKTPAARTASSSTGNGCSRRC